MAAVTVAGLGVVTLLRNQAPAPSPRVDRGALLARDARVDEGPAWPGELDVRGLELPVPAGYVRPTECGTAQDPWRFPGMTRDQVLALARDAQLSPEATSSLSAGLTCDAAGCAVAPPASLVGSLTPSSRGVLYRALRRLPGNRHQAFAYLRPRGVGPWSEMPSLSPRLRALLAQATWSLDDHHAFSDQPWLCAQLDTDDARVEAIRALHTRYGLDVSVRVPSQGDLAPLVRYWSIGNDPAAIRATLTAARGGSASVASLLPPMARARLNQFPPTSALEYDCFWTAARFFEGERPSDHFPGPQGIVALVRDAYAQVPSSEARLGDVVAFVDPDGSFAHTASQVAGDVVFTKNGRSHQRPWVLMHLEEVRALYPLVREVRWYRRRDAR